MRMSGISKHGGKHGKATLPPLPDFILEKIGGKKLVAAGVQFGFHDLKKWTKKKGAANRIQDDGVTTPSQSYITQELKAQILAGNYQALTDARKAAQNDLQANITTINDATDDNKGFVTVVNPSNGQEYRICASNDGWMWTYTTSMSVQDVNGKPQTQCVVQTGSYSANGKILGLSYQTLENIPTAITALAASAMVSFVVGSFIRNLILGKIYQAALDAAVADAEVDAVAGGFMVSEAAAVIGSGILTLLGAGVVAAIVAIVIYYISGFLYRSYGLTISVYNWDPNNAWDISNWYADNAVVAQNNAGSGPWQAVNLLPVQNSVPGPFGPISTTNPVAQYCDYAFQNDSEWLQGLGVAMQVTSANASFYFGYIVQRFASNIIGLSSNTSSSIGDWYNNSDDTFQPSGSYSYTGAIDNTDISVTIITTSLNSDRAYNFEVHIGLAQSI